MKKILYAVTNRTEDETDFYQKIEESLKGGVRILQLREKQVSEEFFLKEALEVKALCKKYAVPLVINDNLKIALSCGADGIHVGENDLSVSEIRKCAHGLMIGATAKTLSRALNAEREGADYLGVGAVFPSPTKKDAVPVTMEMLQEICFSVKIPVYAIGGITKENVSQIRVANLGGVAVSSALFSAENVQAAARELCEKLEEL